MIADYFVIRGRCLNVLGLYKPEGDYCYRNGISYVAPAALVAGILPSLPGFLATIHTAPLYYGSYGGLQIGENWATPVAYEHYDGAFPFTGQLHKVVVELSTDA